MTYLSFASFIAPYSSVRLMVPIIGVNKEKNIYRKYSC